VLRLVEGRTLGVALDTRAHAELEAEQGAGETRHGIEQLRRRDPQHRQHRRRQSEARPLVPSTDLEQPEEDPIQLLDLLEVV
jgi:hypothetical protein